MLRFLLLRRFEESFVDLFGGDSSESATSYPAAADQLWQEDQESEDSIPVVLSVESLSSSLCELTGQPVVYATVKNNHSR